MGTVRKPFLLIPDATRIPKMRVFALSRQEYTHKRQAARRADSKPFPQLRGQPQYHQHNSRQATPRANLGQSGKPLLRLWVAPFERISTEQGFRSVPRGTF